MATTRTTAGAPIGFYDVDTTFGQNEQKRDVEDQIHLLDPDASPLVAFTGKNAFAKRSINSRKFEWYTDRDRAVVTTTATTGTGTTIVVSDATATNFIPGDLIYFPEYEEISYVTVVGAAGSAGGSDTNLTVIRDYGSTRGLYPGGGSAAGGGATLAGTSQIVNLGQAAGEKSSIPLSIFLNPTNCYNYAQLWIESVELTRDVLNAEYYGYGGKGESVRKHEHKKHVIRYNKQREYQAYFGLRGSVAAGGTPAWDVGRTFMTAGLRTAIVTNAFNFSGVALTESLLLSKTKDMFRYGNHSRKALICSPQMSARMSSWGLSAIRVQAGEGSWGFKISEWQTPHGILEIIPCWLLGDVATGQNFDGDWFTVVDMSEIKQAVMEPTTLSMNQQNPESIRTIKDVYQGISGWQWGVEQYHCEGYGWV